MNPLGRLLLHPFLLATFLVVVLAYVFLRPPRPDQAFACSAGSRLVGFANENALVAMTSATPHTPCFVEHLRFGISGIPQTGATIIDTGEWITIPPLSPAAHSADAKRVAVLMMKLRTKSRAIGILDLGTSTLIREVFLPSLANGEPPTPFMALSPDGRWLAYTDGKHPKVRGPGEVTLLNVDSGEVAWRRTESGLAAQLIFSPLGDKLLLFTLDLIGNQAKSILVQREDGREIANVTEPMFAPTFLNNDHLLGIGLEGDSFTLCKYDLSARGSRTVVRSFPRHEHEFDQIVGIVSANEALLTRTHVPDQDTWWRKLLRRLRPNESSQITMSLLLVSLSTGRVTELLSYEGTSEPVIAPDGKRIALKVDSMAETVQLWPTYRKDWGAWGYLFTFAPPPLLLGAYYALRKKKPGAVAPG